MKSQSYSSHRRLIPMYHFGVFSLVLALLIGAVVNLVKVDKNSEAFYSASLVLIISIILFFLFFFIRIFSLKAQDRAIRAEESLRYFVLSGKLLDKRLSVKQIVALRFASDEEFVALTQRAAENDMKPNDIKKAIANWKGDFYRV